MIFPLIRFRCRNPIVIRAKISLNFQKIDSISMQYQLKSVCFLLRFLKFSFVVYPILWIIYIVKYSTESGILPIKLLRDLYFLIFPFSSFRIFITKINKNLRASIHEFRKSSIPFMSHRFIIPIRIRISRFYIFRFLFESIFHTIVIQKIRNPDRLTVQLRLIEQIIKIITKIHIGNFIITFNRISVKQTQLTSRRKPPTEPQINIPTIVSRIVIFCVRMIRCQFAIIFQSEEFIISNIGVIMSERQIQSHFIIENILRFQRSFYRISVTFAKENIGSVVRNKTLFFV